MGRRSRDRDGDGGDGRGLAIAGALVAALAAAILLSTEGSATTAGACGGTTFRCDPSITYGPIVTTALAAVFLSGAGFAVAAWRLPWRRSLATAGVVLGTVVLLPLLPLAVAFPTLPINLLLLGAGIALLVGGTIGRRADREDRGSGAGGGPVTE